MTTDNKFEAVKQAARKAHIDKHQTYFDSRTARSEAYQAEVQHVIKREERRSKHIKWTKHRSYFTQSLAARVSLDTMASYLTEVEDTPITEKDLRDTFMRLKIPYKAGTYGEQE